MKLSFFGLCLAGAATALLYTGSTAQFSGASAQEGCIVTLVQHHVKRCPEGVTLATASGTAASAPEPVEATVTPTAVEPTVTPTAAPAEGCINTLIAHHIRRCPTAG
jgi:hypothetical protein